VLCVRLLRGVFRLSRLAENSISCLCLIPDGRENVKRALWLLRAAASGCLTLTCLTLTITSENVQICQHKTASDSVITRLSRFQQKKVVCVFGTPIALYIHHPYCLFFFCNCRGWKGTLFPSHMQIARGLTEWTVNIPALETCKQGSSASPDRTVSLFPQAIREAGQLNHILANTRYLLSDMPYSLPSTSESSLQSTEKINQGAVSGESQQQRYASFFCYAYLLLSKHGPSATVHVPYRSTSSMITPCSTYSISTGHFF
jgi:hypothetical protein